LHRLAIGSANNNELVAEIQSTSSSLSRPADLYSVEDHPQNQRLFCEILINSLISSTINNFINQRFYLVERTRDYPDF
jgi:hypothetical protein